jgi:hypothetical protein
MVAPFYVWLKSDGFFTVVVVVVVVVFGGEKV